MALAQLVHELAASVRDGGLGFVDLLRRCHESLQPLLAEQHHRSWNFAGEQLDQNLLVLWGALGREATNGPFLEKIGKCLSETAKALAHLGRHGPLINLAEFVKSDCLPKRSRLSTPTAHRWLDAKRLDVIWRVGPGKLEVLVGMQQLGNLLLEKLDRKAQGANGAGP